jgi:membrane protein DedA with SNARE-associated domain
MTVVAGALRLRHRTFLAGTVLAGLIWATLYFWLGWLLGAGYERLAGSTHAPPWLPVAVVLAAAAVAGAALWLNRRRRARAGSGAGSAARRG